MHVLERGTPSTQPLVLLHGVGTGARAWEPQLAAFSDSRWVLAPDLPGFGGSLGTFSIPGAVAELHDELRQRGVERADVCGLSLGALAALAYAIEHPDEVATLTLCAGFARLPRSLRETQAGMAAALAGMSEAEFAPAREGLAAAVPEPYRAAALEDIAGFTPASLAAVMAEAGDFDVTERLGGLQMPVLVLCGERDEMNAPLCRSLAVLLGADLQRVPGAGHVANLDAPDAFSALLRRFLNEHSQT